MSAADCKSLNENEPVNRLHVRHSSLDKQVPDEAYSHTYNINIAGTAESATEMCSILTTLDGKYLL
jgi:hypothetical protein